MRLHNKTDAISIGRLRLKAIRAPQYSACSCLISCNQHRMPFIGNKINDASSVTELKEWTQLWILCPVSLRQSVNVLWRWYYVSRVSLLARVKMRAAIALRLCKSFLSFLVWIDAGLMKLITAVCYEDGTVTPCDSIVGLMCRLRFILLIVVSEFMKVFLKHAQ